MIALVEFFPLAIVFLPDLFYLLVKLFVHFFELMLSTSFPCFRKLRPTLLLRHQFFLFPHRLFFALFRRFSILKLLICRIPVKILGLSIGLISPLQLYSAMRVGGFVGRKESSGSAIDSLILRFVLIFDRLLIFRFLRRELVGFVLADIFLLGLALNGVVYQLRRLVLRKLALVAVVPGLRKRVFGGVACRRVFLGRTVFPPLLRLGSTLAIGLELSDKAVVRMDLSNVKATILRLALTKE